MSTSENLDFEFLIKKPYTGHSSPFLYIEFGLVRRKKHHFVEYIPAVAFYKQQETQEDNLMKIVT